MHFIFPVFLFWLLYELDIFLINYFSPSMRSKLLISQGNHFTVPLLFPAYKVLPRQSKELLAFFSDPNNLNTRHDLH